jgi:YihY family inner membrane protein
MSQQPLSRLYLWKEFKLRFAYLRQLLVQTFSRYGAVNGEQCAASFAYYAFFSLFPLILLAVAASTFFVTDRSQATERVLALIESYTPLLAKDRQALAAIVAHVIRHGAGASVFGLLALVWSSLRFFQALVIGVNRAWGLPDHNWWKLPLKNLLMIGLLVGALGVGVVAPLLTNQTLAVTRLNIPWFSGILTDVLPAIFMFCGLALFYKFAPRRALPFQAIWPAALIATILLKAGQWLFGLYLSTGFGNFNAIYGTFGTIMALMLWIYFSGVMIILSCCFAAVVYPGQASEPRKSAGSRPAVST